MGSRLATLGSVLANWRDWNLPVKLAAVTLVPVVFAIVLGAMQIADQVDRASSYRRVDRLVVVNEELRSLVAALQRERTTGAVLIAARAGDVEAELRDERAAVDSARVAFVRATGRVTIDDGVTAARHTDVVDWLAELPGMREQVSGALIDASTVIERYTDIVDALLRFDRALSAEAIDPTLVSTSSALHDLESVREQVQLQHALVGVGIVRGGIVGQDLDALRTSLARFEDSITDFRAVAGEPHVGAFERVIDQRKVTGRTNLVGTIVASPPGTPVPTTAGEWNAASAVAAGGVAEVAEALGTRLRDRSAALQDEASDGAGLAAVILLVALVVAIAVMFVVGRHLLSSLSALRHGALEVAELGLPTAVARIRDRGEESESITFQPVPVTSMDEVGQVARAFDAVQRQALRLATEQAGLRARYASVFVNLSRRSQGLVQRQLHLLERLERDEEDADQLATLFQLDHLATRMRRNNENLMVLSGSDVSRRNQRPATLADLLRAAVSEIEQYQRVVMLPPPDVRVVGYAVGDLVRLTAELLDNATVFSPPDTTVTIASHSFEDSSVCIAVLDEGIGMNQAELDEANAKLADTASIDVTTSRRMGLFVIGRLASRHGVEVHLGGGPDVVGVRATVTVPADLVTAPYANQDDGQPPTVLAPAGAPSSGLVPFAPRVDGIEGAANGTNGTRPAPLPRRTSQTNGTNGTDIAKLLGGETDGTDAAPSTPPAHDTETAQENAPETDQEDTSEGTAGSPQPADGRAPLPRRSPGRPGQPPAGTRSNTPFTPASEPLPPSDRLFSSPGEPSHGETPPPAGAPPAPRPESRRTPAGGLFAPADRRGPVDPLAETTPIFDEMISAWFRAVSDQPAGDEPVPPTNDDPWRFSADAGFQAARQVSSAEPAEYTDNGLPRRDPRQHLVPGSVAEDADPPDDQSRPNTSAADVRERLSDYRQGVRRARDRHSGPLDTPAEDWRSAADLGWRTANAVSTSTPVDFTSGGLPRRTPRNHLVPGSVAPDVSNGPADGAPMADRAEEVRGRLGSFQKGLSRGRRSLAERGTANGSPDNKQQEGE